MNSNLLNPTIKVSIHFLAWSHCSIHSLRRESFRSRSSFQWLRSPAATAATTTCGLLFHHSSPSHSQRSKFFRISSNIIGPVERPCNTVIFQLVREIVCPFRCCSPLSPRRQHLRLTRSTRQSLLPQDVVICQISIIPLLLFAHATSRDGHLLESGLCKAKKAKGAATLSSYSNECGVFYFFISRTYTYIFFLSRSFVRFFSFNLALLVPPSCSALSFSFLFFFKLNNDEK